MKTYDSPWVKDNIGSYTRELEPLLEEAALKHYGAEEPVYIQGERSCTFYFLKKGKVKISIFREDGSEKILAIMEDNTFFGESAAFDEQPYFATATVLEPSDIFQIRRDTLKRVIGKEPSVALMLLTALIRKMRLMAFQIEDFSFLDAQKRVVHILLTVAGEVGVQGKEGVDIQKRITHEDFARLTGLSRVTVTNILNYLERVNVIRKKRCSVMITDLEKLKSLLGTTTTKETICAESPAGSIGKGGCRPGRI